MTDRGDLWLPRRAIAPGRVPADDVLRRPVDRRAFLSWTARSGLAGMALLGAFGAAGCGGSDGNGNGSGSGGGSGGSGNGGTGGTGGNGGDLPASLKVGVIVPVTGVGQFVGEVVDRSLRAAQAHIEAENLFPGTKVNYQIVNAPGEELTDATSRAYAELVSDPDVVGILWCTVVGLKEARAQIVRDEMPVIAVFADLWSEGLLYPDGPERSIFQYIQPDRLSIDIMVRYLKEDRGYDTTALLYDSTLGHMTRDNFEAALAKHGMQAAGIEEFKLFTADFGAQLQRLREQHGESLFVWGVADSVANIVKGIDALDAGYVDRPTAQGSGWHPQLLGWPAGTGEKKWAELAGDAAKVGTLTTWNLGGLVAQPTFPIRTWMQEYLDTFPTGGEESPANCYWAILESVRRAGTTDRRRVVEELEKVRGTFAGLEFSFGDEHLAMTEDELVLITLERHTGPVDTDPPYQLGREWEEVFIPEFGEYTGPTHLVRPTIEANRRAHPEEMDLILEEGWGTICTVEPPDRLGTDLEPTNDCEIH